MSGTMMSTVNSGTSGDDVTTTRGPGARPSRTPWWRRPSFWADWGVVVALGLLLVGFGLLAPGFLRTANLFAILVSASMLVVLALGQASVISTGGIDLSQGSIVGLSSVVIGQGIAGGLSAPVAGLLGIAAGATAGLISGLLVAKGRITDFIVTLGMLSVAFGLGLVISDGRPIQLIEPFLLRLATSGIGPVRWLVLIAVVSAVVAHVLLFHRPAGTHLLAAGGNAAAARAMGISVDRVKIAVYTISGAAAGIVGLMLTARVGAAEPTMQTNLLLNSVAAVVLGGVSLFGGRATVVGPVAGAVFLISLTNGLTSLGVGQFYQQIAVGAVVILSALLMRGRE
jgi:ribose transport system permease protein